MMKLKWICLLVILVCFIQIINAQKLTLQEAIDLGLKNNFDIQLSRNEVEISKLNNSFGMAGGLPTVVGTANDQESIINIHQKLNSGVDIKRNGVTSNALNANILGSIVLFNGYRIKATQQKLNALQKQTEASLNADILTLVQNVMVSYYGIVKQQNFIEALQQSIELSENQLSLVKLKQQIGLANNADLFQSQIDLNTRMQEMQQQQLFMIQAKTDLANLLNLATTSEIEINDSIVNEDPLEYNEVLTSIEQNPLLISLSQQIKVNELIEKEIASQRKFSLRANAGLNLSNNKSGAGQVLLNQSYGPYVGLNLSVPIYNGGINKRQTSIAKVNTQQATLTKEQILASYKTSVLKLYQTYASSVEQLNTQKNTFQLAKQLVDLSTKRFELGAATILELREAQKSFEDAAYQLVSLKYTLKLAEIELKKISNKLKY